MKKIILIISFFVFVLLSFAFSVSANEIKIVQFSDVHLDSVRNDTNVRKFKQSTGMFQKAISKVNQIKPDIVVFSGDMVNRAVESEFDIFLDNALKLNTKFYPIMGNHDVGVLGGLSKKNIINKLNQRCDWLNIKDSSYYVIKDEYIFIFLDGTTDKIITAQGYFPPKTLEFLEQTLDNNKNKKAVIVQHFPLIPPFKSISHEIKNSKEYFDIIDRHENIIMILSGHYHASIAKVRNNTVYITTPSLIEYPHAFRFITVKSDNENLIISSKLYKDDEQNAIEAADTQNNKLKLGKDEYNNFSVTIKNPVKEKFWSLNLF